MPIVAVVNRKGGSGKSTLATHLAAAGAHAGRRVMLGDVDRQQSAQAWLKLRAAQQLPAEAAIAGWALDPKNVLRVPAGITQVVIDTPGGLRGFELARIVMNADAILMPVCNSVFDRDSAAECYEELKTLPRVASGRCKVAAIGMRLDARTRAAEVLAQWAEKLGLPFVGVLREAQVYVRCVEHGLTLFDLPAAQVQADLAQWQPILAWLGPVLDPATAPLTAARPVPAPNAPVVPDSLLSRRPPTSTPRPMQPAREASSVRPGPLAPSAQSPLTASSLPSLQSIQSLRPAPTAPVARPLQSAPSALSPTSALVAQPVRAAQAGQPHRSEAPAPAARHRAASPAPTTDRAAPPSGPALRPDVSRRPPLLPSREPVLRGAAESRLGRLLEALPIPRFLQRNS